MTEPASNKSRNVIADPPPAIGVRLQWGQLPSALRKKIEGRAGGSVVQASTQPGGFSPGVAARLRLSDGRWIFVKAVHPSGNSAAPNLHRREAVVASGLPSGTPAPRLLWTIDQDVEGWVVLAYEDVDGRHPKQPWSGVELEVVLEALVDLSERLTPSPIETESAAEFYEREICSWRLLKDSPPDSLDEWSCRNIEALTNLDARAIAAVKGQTLLHLDIRADNILLTDNKVYFVDWPHARVGAAWVDIVFMAPSVTMQGGPPPDEFCDRHPAFAAAPMEGITAVIAAEAGFFTHRSHQPPPPGLPTLRAFQRAQAEVAREWLAQRSGWS